MKRAGEKRSQDKLLKKWKGKVKGAIKASKEAIILSMTNNIDDSAVEIVVYDYTGQIVEAVVVKNIGVLPYKVAYSILRDSQKRARRLRRKSKRGFALLTDNIDLDEVAVQYLRDCKDAEGKPVLSEEEIQEFINKAELVNFDKLAHDYTELQGIR